MLIFCQPFFPFLEKFSEEVFSIFDIWVFSASTAPFFAVRTGSILYIVARFAVIHKGCHADGKRMPWRRFPYYTTCDRIFPVTIYGNNAIGTFRCVSAEIAASAYAFSQ